jgi:hypothetical protein
VCDKSFEKSIVENYLKENEEDELLEKFKKLWSPPKDGKYIKY